MNANTLIIEEKGQSTKSSKSMILSLIDNQINQYKLNFMSSWEGDHSISDLHINERINALKAKKEKVKKMFDQLNDDHEAVDVIFSVSVQATVKEKEKTLEYSA